MNRNFITLGSLIVICVIFFEQICAAQTFTPQFQMPFYFKDAVGNKDTVWIGYDNHLHYSSTIGHHDPLYDGAIINQPFDSVFEVRVFHLDDVENINSFTTNNISVAYDYFPGTSCGVSEYACIVVHCKYPPAIMYYDSTLMASNTCENNTILADGFGVHVLQYWWDADVDCLGNASEVNLNLAVNDYNNPLRFSITDVNIEGGYTDTLPGFFLGFKDYGPCNNFIIGTKTYDGYTAGNLSVSPNPAHGSIQVALPSGIAGKADWQLINTMGQTAARGAINHPAPGENLSIEVSAFPKGVYLMIIRTATGNWTGKVMVE